MLWTHMMKNSGLYSFKHGIKGFGGIDVDITPGIFFSHMINALMRSKLFSSMMENIAFIRHQIRGSISHSIDNWRNSIFFHCINRDWKYWAFPLNGDKDALLVSSFGDLVPDAKMITRFAAYEFFIHFNGAAQQR